MTVNNLATCITITNNVPTLYSIRDIHILGEGFIDADIPPTYSYILLYKTRGTAIKQLQ